MIEKIVSIKNVGTFSNYSANSKYKWDGKFSKINVIYAPNGSGKTTLSTIFNSLTNIKPELLHLKQTLNQNESPEVKIKFEGQNNLVSYKGRKWGQAIHNILVFDIHFIEDFLFLSSITNEKNVKNLANLLLGTKGSTLRNRFKNLKKKNRTFTTQLDNLRLKNKANKNTLTLENNLKQNEIAIEKVLLEYTDYAFPIFKEYVESTNKYLSRFTNSIRVKSLITPSKKFDEAKFYVNLNLEIEGKTFRFKNPDFSKKEGSVKFTLSEGDKNAVALSFFLALIEIKGSSDKIIVIDDPLSSFDSNRKTSTINLLAKVALNCEQFIMLTHDIQFAKSIKEKLNFTSCLNLKIEKDSKSSILSKHDIDFETLSGYQKDIYTVKNYQSLINKTEADRRQVIRCIRPILETLIKTKYYEYFNYNDWLGDIISKVRKTDSNSAIGNLKFLLSDIIDLNDFTKKYHHSDSELNTIDDSELNFYLTLLEKLVLKI